MKKALVFVLALILLVGVFAACGDKPAETTGPATTAGTTEAPSSTGTPTTETPTTETPTTTQGVQEELTMNAADKDAVADNDTPVVELPEDIF